MYAKGNGIEKNALNSIKYSTMAAKQGHLEAQFNLGNSYHLLDKKNVDYEKAYYWYKKAADKGHAGAQYNIGRMNLLGLYVPKNKKKGIEWLKKSASQGEKLAKETLESIGSTKQCIKYEECFMLASLGNAKAQHDLGTYHFSGLVAPKNMKQAFKWSEESAKQGHGEAFYGLGMMYFYVGNVEKAKYWHTRGIKEAEYQKNLSNADFQYFIGCIYRDSAVIKNDNEQIFKYYSRAAKLGHKKAQNQLGKMHFKKKNN